ncbi:MAG: LPD11 domain-containing protein [Streptococcus sp.]
MLATGVEMQGNSGQAMNKLQIEYMVALYNSFDEDSKPQWLTLDEIYEFKELMCDNSYK